MTKIIVHNQDNITIEAKNGLFSDVEIINEREIIVTYKGEEIGLRKQLVGAASCSGCELRKIANENDIMCHQIVSDLPICTTDSGTYFIWKRI